MKTIYIEKALLEHPITLAVKRRYPHSHRVICEHYGEVFNRQAQNFRLQKQAPALILAEKRGSRVLKTPESFGIGGIRNYYFSHFLNCLYDCRYCFLQGMYSSANYVWFINYEDFQNDINTLCQAHPDETFYFFSGYDSDSLALEPVTRFAEHFLPFFKKIENAYLELRTKSVQIRSLLEQQAFERCVVAFSFTPSYLSRVLEHGVPSVESRIEAMVKLASQGWRLGLRFDPIMDCKNFEQVYQDLFSSIFKKVPIQSIHSVSLGPLRFPKKMYDRIHKLYPEEKLFMQAFEKRAGQVTYKTTREKEMKAIILKQLSHYVDESFIFECHAL